MSPRDKINKVMAAQLGVITRAQALSLGLHPRSVDRQLANGTWKVVYRGVYRTSSVPPTWRQTLLAACLYVGQPVAASHRAAAALLGLEGCPEGVVELSVATKRKRTASRLILHMTDLLGNGDLAKMGPIPLTTATRTLIDLGGVVSEQQLEIAMDDALRRGLTSISRLEAKIAALGGKGHRGVGVARSLLEKKGIRFTESGLEVKLARLIRESDLPDPVKQYEIWDRGKLVARVDFAYPEKMVCIEADSYGFHSQPLDLDRDRGRQNDLVGLGWKIFRATSNDVNRRPKATVEFIRSLLRDA